MEWKNFSSLSLFSHSHFLALTGRQVMRQNKLDMKLCMYLAHLHLTMLTFTSSNSPFHSFFFPSRLWLVMLHYSWLRVELFWSSMWSKQKNEKYIWRLPNLVSLYCSLCPWCRRHFPPIIHLCWAPAAPICRPFHLALTPPASHPPDTHYTTKSTPWIDQCVKKNPVNHQTVKTHLYM